MPLQAAKWAHILAFLCLGNIIYCGLVAMRQRNLNLLIGNSSVAHMGFAFLGLASLSAIGISGTVLIMVAHGFLAALTFALSGYLDEELKTLEIGEMGGLLRHLPFIGTAMIMAMLAGCGLPGFANFPGEMMVLFGSWDRYPVVVVIAIWGALVIGGVYMLRAIRNILLGCFPRLLTDSIRTSVEPMALMASGEYARALKAAEKTPLPTSTNAVPSPAATNAAPRPTAINAAPRPAATNAAPRPAATNVALRPASTNAVPAPARTNAVPRPASTNAAVRPATNAAPAPAPSSQRLDATPVGLRPAPTNTPAPAPPTPTR
jgi:hypothetical protein